MQTAESTRLERHPALDGIGGLAILFVLASHVSDHKGLGRNGVGQFAVWLFFVLSSFLLSLCAACHLSFIVIERPLSRVSLKRFMGRPSRVTPKDEIVRSPAV